MKKNIILVHWVDVPQQWAIDLYYYTKYLSLSSEINIKTIISNTFLSKEDDFMKNNFIEIWNNYNKWFFSSIKFIYKAFIKIKQLNKESKIDYVHFFSMHPMSVVLQFFVKYFLRISTIYDIISWPIWKWPIYYISYISERLWVFFSKKYVIDNENLINLLNFSSNKTHIEIWIWCEYKNINFIKNSFIEKKENEIIFTYIWTLNKDRELLTFINVFNDLTKIDNVIYKLFIIWRWDNEENLKNYSKTNNIEFLWYKNHSDIFWYINDSDILISYIPQKIYFDFQPPTKLLEWFSMWKPVICTSTSVQKELLKEYKEFLFEDNYESLYNKVIEIWNDFKKYSKDDMKKIVENYTWEKLINDKLIPFYLR